MLGAIRRLAHCASRPRGCRRIRRVLRCSPRLDLPRSRLRSPRKRAARDGWPQNQSGPAGTLAISIRHCPCVVLPESRHRRCRIHGNDDLAEDLAEQLGTVWVPEYGRRFTEEQGVDHLWHSADFEAIAQHQAADEDRTARRSGPILVCDTDVLATAIWHERYMGGRSTVVEALAATRRPDLYVLTGDEIPFVQDGMRDGEHLRLWMTGRFRELLNSSGVPWVEAHGDPQSRVEIVIESLADLKEVGET